MRGRCVARTYQWGKHKNSYRGSAACCNYWFEAYRMDGTASEGERHDVLESYPLPREEVVEGCQNC